MDKLLAQMTAREFMSREVVSVGPDDTVQEAITLLQENTLSTLPVTSPAGKVVGIISARDILQWAEELDTGISELMEVSAFYRDWMVSQAGEESRAAKVKELMNDQVVTANLETHLPQVVSIMLRNEIHHLPITDEKERMIGFVSTTDVMRIVADTLSAEPVA